MITHGEKAELADTIEKLFNSSKFVVEKYRYKYKSKYLENYLSDNFTFNDKGAIGIKFCKKAKLGKGYYIPDIHCNKDTTLNLNHIEFLTDEMLKLQNITKEA